MHLVWRGDGIYKWDRRDYLRADDTQDKVRHLGLYDAEGELVTPGDMALVQTARLRCKGAKTGGAAFSTAVEIHRISGDLLLDDDVDHLSTRGRVKRLDVFRYWSELWTRGREVMRQVTRGHTFTNLTAKHVEKNKHLEELKPTLSQGLNDAVKRKLQLAGIHISMKAGDGAGGSDTQLTAHTRTVRWPRSTR
jgi:hypothetical protein